MTEDTWFIYYKLHNICTFQVENLSIHRIIDQLTTVTGDSDWTLILLHNNTGQYVRSAMCEHYDGPDSANKRLAMDH